MRILAGPGSRARLDRDAAKIMVMAKGELQNVIVLQLAFPVFGNDAVLDNPGFVNPGISKTDWLLPD